MDRRSEQQVYSRIRGFFSANLSNGKIITLFFPV